MGWLFAYSTGYKKKNLVEDLRKPSRFGENTQLLQSCVKGNNHWYLAKTGDQIWIGLDLMQGGGRCQGWGYKDMDETCGPCQMDCPITYLDKASEPTGYAIEWRRNVRALHAKRKVSAKPVSGMVVTYGGQTYTLVEPYRPRKGWLVTNALGDRCRMNAKQLARALRVELPDPF